MSLSKMSDSLPNVEDSVDYDPEAGVYRATFDSTSIEPSTAVVAAIADIRDVDPIELGPLSHTISPKSLNTLCSGRQKDSDCTVDFEYLDCRIRISSYGLLEIEPISD